MTISRNARSRWQMFQQEHPYRVVAFASALDSVRFLIGVIVSVQLLTMSGADSKGIVALAFPINFDNVIEALTFLVLGGWLGLTINFVLLNFKLLGGLIDSEYDGLEWGGWTLHKYALPSGALAAVGVGMMLYSRRLYNGAMVAALLSGAVIYSAFYDALKRKNVRGRSLVMPTALVILGVFLSSYTGFEIGLKAGLQAVLLLFLFQSLITAGSSQLSQNGSRESPNTAIYLLWRFGYLALIGTLIAIVVSISTGRLDDFISLIWRRETLTAGALIALSQLFVVFVNGFRTRATKVPGVSVAKTGLIMKANVVLSFIIVWIVNSYAKGFFGPFDNSIEVLVPRIIGVLIIVVGLFFLSRAQEDN